MDLYFSGESIIEKAQADGRTFGLYLMIGSLLVAFVALWIYTSSFMLSFMFLYHLLCTYVWANLIYRIIINFHTFSLNHVLAIYVIGSISIVHFIHYMSTWLSPACRALTDPAAKMTFVYLRCKRTLWVTSLVAAASLFVSSSSNLVAVMTVDVFMGLLVFVNYISATVFFPSFMLVWGTHFEKRNIFCKTTVALDNSATADPRYIILQLDKKH